MGILGPAVSVSMAVVVAATFASGASQGQQKEEEYRLHIHKWASDASLLRKKKTVPKVVKGTSLFVADVLATIVKAIEVKGGLVDVESIDPHSVVRYTSIEPPQLNPVGDVEYTRELMAGQLYHRISILSEKSKYSDRVYGISAASRGTAYLVNKLPNGEAEVLVAEGKVSVTSDSDKDKELVLLPRQKVRVGKSLPAAAQPVTDDDEARVRRLLSLPIQNLRGYSDPRDLHRTDAQDIVTLRVRNALMVFPADEREKGEQRPNSVVDLPSGYEFNDLQGDLLSLTGWKFLGASKDGTIQVAYRADKGSCVLDNAGKIRRVLCKERLENVVVAPDGKRVFGFRQGMETVKPKDPSDSTHVEGLNIFDPASAVVNANTLVPFGSYEVVFRHGGTRGFIVVHDGGHYRVFGCLGHQAYVTADTPNMLILYDSSFPPAISPGGTWIVEDRPGPEFQATRTTDGFQTSFQSTSKPAYYMSKGSDGYYELVAVTDRSGAKRFINPGAQVTSPILPNSMDLSAIYSQGAVSPNGELITFREPKTSTAHVADSEDLARRSDTYVGVRAPYVCSWISGDTVWYKDGPPDKCEEILITLGVKRKGAVPRDPNDSAPDLITELPFSDDPFIHEFNVGGINDDGLVAGIAKGDGMGGFLAGGLDAQAVSLNTPFACELCLPFSIGNDGTIAGNHIEEPYHIFAYRPDKGVVLEPDAFGPSTGLRVMNDGTVYDHHQIWHPWEYRQTWAKSDPPFGGWVDDNPTPGMKLMAVSPNKHFVALKLTERNDYQVYTGVLGKSSNLIEEVSIPGLGTMDNDYRRPPNWGVMEEQFFVNDEGQCCWMRMKGNAYKLELFTPNVGVTVLEEHADSRMPGPGYDLRGLGPDGAVYGAEMPMNREPHGFVFCKGLKIDLDDVLPEGYRCGMVRYISPKGLLVGEFKRNGQAVIAVVNLAKAAQAAR